MWTANPIQQLTANNPIEVGMWTANPIQQWQQTTQLIASIVTHQSTKSTLTIVPRPNNKLNPENLITTLTLEIQTSIDNYTYMKTYHTFSKISITQTELIATKQNRTTNNKLASIESNSRLSSHTHIGKVESIKLKPGRSECSKKKGNSNQHKHATDETEATTLNQKKTFDSQLNGIKQSTSSSTENHSQQS